MPVCAPKPLTPKKTNWCYSTPPLAGTLQQHCAAGGVCVLDGCGREWGAVAAIAARCIPAPPTCCVPPPLPTLLLHCIPAPPPFYSQQRQEGIHGARQGATPQPHTRCPYYPQMHSPACPFCPAPAACCLARTQEGKGPAAVRWRWQPWLARPAPPCQQPRRRVWPGRRGPPPVTPHRSAPSLLPAPSSSASAASLDAAPGQPEQSQTAAAAARPIPAVTALGSDPGAKHAAPPRLPPALPCCCCCRHASLSAVSAACAPGQRQQTGRQQAADTSPHPTSPATAFAGRHTTASDARRTRPPHCSPPLFSWPSFLSGPCTPFYACFCPFPSHSSH
jgi:hypothetical protein